MENNQKTTTDLFFEKKILESQLSAANDLIDYYLAKSERLSEENEKLKAWIQELESKNKNQKSCTNAVKKRIIEWLDRSKELEKRCDDLAKELDRAINYIKMTRKF